MNNIFKIKKEERIPVLIALVVFIALNILMVTYHYDPFTRGGKVGYWTIFSRDFEISGFDFYTYLTLSKWDGYYTEFRHPLLQFLWYPFYLINHWQMSMTEKNISIHLVAGVMVVLSTYSFVFMHRIFREVMELGKLDANLLTGLFFSLAYIMVAVFVPDHFGISLFFISTKKLEAKKAEQEKAEKEKVEKVEASESVEKENIESTVKTEKNESAESEEVDTKKVEDSALKENKSDVDKGDK